MTVTVKTVQSVAVIGDELIPVMYIVIEGEQDIAGFKKLVQQGSCLTPDMSAAMKELADLVTSGKVQQPYRSMS